MFLEEFNLAGSMKIYIILYTSLKLYQLSKKRRKKKIYRGIISNVIASLGWDFKRRDVGWMNDAFLVRMIDIYT